MTEEEESLEEELSEAEEIQNLIKYCLQTPVEELVKNEDWGIMNFEESSDDLKLLFSLIEPLQSMPLKEVPGRQIKNIKLKITEVRDILEAIREFNIEEGDARGRRDGIVSRLKPQIDQLYALLAQIVPYLAYRHGDTKAQQEMIQGVIKETREQAEETREQAEEARRQAEELSVWVETKKSSVEKIVDATKQAAATTGVGTFTSNFYSQAETHKNKANHWLIASGILGGVAVLAALAFLYFTLLLDYSSTAQAISFSATKVVILGLLIASMIWCGQIYRTQKHLETVNQHRANSLRTFQAFVEATNDPQIRDAVLLEATRSIFTITKSGYIGAGADSSSPTQQVFEIVRGASGGTDSSK